MAFRQNTPRKAKAAKPTKPKPKYGKAGKNLMDPSEAFDDDYQDEDPYEDPFYFGSPMPVQETPPSALSTHASSSRVVKDPRSKKASAPFVPPAQQRVVQPTHSLGPIYDELIAVRTRIAEPRRLKPENVFSDRVIEDLSITLPTGKLQQTLVPVFECFVLNRF